MGAYVDPANTVKQHSMHGSSEKCEFLDKTAIFTSAPMKRLLEQVRKIAASNATVLITGESGSGKEIIARAIHHFSPRSAKSWVDVNCAALPENLLESELFGYEKGAFSGADSSKPGLFEMANQGTLFLDEIGELDHKIQAKLLRALDGSSYYRLGGVRKIPVNIRLVTATNRDLKKAVSDGSFRPDLYHRLSQIQIQVPPLRDRPEDVVPIASYFLAEQNPDLSFSPEVAERLRAYSWPGNVRELQNVVIRAAVLASSNEIVLDGLPDELVKEAFSASLERLAVLPQLERDAIIKALDESGEQRLAAEKLGISRRTLQRRVKAYGITSSRSASMAQ